MGGGDLNLKKSFHPSLLKNQARRYDEEQKALNERKKTQQRIQEIKEERAKEEVQRQLELAGGRKRIDRVDWMYQGPNNGTAGTSEEQEAFLLGKRSIEKVLIGNDNQKLIKDAAQDSFLSSSGNAAENAKDIAAKIRDDPLLAIRMQEQATLQAMAKRGVLEGKGKGKGTERERERGREHRHQHRSRRHRSRSRDSRESSPRRRDREDGRRSDRRERDRDRDRSDRRDRDREYGRDQDRGGDRRLSQRDGVKREHEERDCENRRDRGRDHHREDRGDGDRPRGMERRSDRSDRDRGDRSSRRERSPRSSASPARD